MPMDKVLKQIEEIRKKLVRKQIDVGEVKDLLEMLQQLRDTVAESIDKVTDARNLSDIIYEEVAGKKWSMEVELEGFALPISIAEYVPNRLKYASNTLDSIAGDLAKIHKTISTAMRVVEEVLRELQSRWEEAEAVTGLEE